MGNREQAQNRKDGRRVLNVNVSAIPTVPRAQNVSKATYSVPYKKCETSTMLLMQWATHGATFRKSHPCRSVGQVSKHGLPSVRQTAFLKIRPAEQGRREDGHRPPNMARNQRKLPVALAVAERREAILARIWPHIKRQKRAHCPQGINRFPERSKPRRTLCESSFLGALTPQKT